MVKLRHRCLADDELQVMLTCLAKSQVLVLKIAQQDPPLHQWCPSTNRAIIVSQMFYCESIVAKLLKQSCVK